MRCRPAPVLLFFGNFHTCTSMGGSSHAPFMLCLTYTWINPFSAFMSIWIDAFWSCLHFSSLISIQIPYCTYSAWIFQHVWIVAYMYVCGCTLTVQVHLCVNVTLRMKHVQSNITSVRELYAYCTCSMWTAYTHMVVCVLTRYNVHVCGCSCLVYVYVSAFKNLVIYAISSPPLNVKFLRSHMQAMISLIAHLTFSGVSFNWVMHVHVHVHVHPHIKWEIQTPLSTSSHMWHSLSCLSPHLLGNHPDIALLLCCAYLCMYIIWT